MIVVWGALTGRRWTVAVAATLAVPAFYLHTLTMLYAIFRLQADGTARCARDQGGAVPRLCGVTGEGAPKV